MKILFALAAMLLLAGGFNVTAIESASAQCAGPCGAVLVPAPNPIPMRRFVVLPAPVAVAPCGARLRQWPGRVCGTAAMRAGRLRRHGLHLFPEAPLCLLEAARLHRLLSRPRQLLLAPGLLVRFIRPPLLQLSRPPGSSREMSHETSKRGDPPRGCSRYESVPAFLGALFTEIARARAFSKRTSKTQRLFFHRRDRTWLHLPFGLMRLRRVACCRWLPSNAASRYCLRERINGVSFSSIGIRPRSPHLCYYPAAAGGRTFPSAAGFQTSEVFFTDDSGSYLFESRDTAVPVERDGDLAVELLRLLAAHKKQIRKLSDKTGAFPASRNSGLRRRRQSLSVVVPRPVFSCRAFGGAGDRSLRWTTPPSSARPRRMDL